MKTIFRSFGQREKRNIYIIYIFFTKLRFSFSSSTKCAKSRNRVGRFRKVGKRPNHGTECIEFVSLFVDLHCIPYSFDPRQLTQGAKPLYDLVPNIFDKITHLHQMSIHLSIILRYRILPSKKLLEHIYNTYIQFTIKPRLCSCLNTAFRTLCTSPWNSDS